MSKLDILVSQFDIHKLIDDLICHGLIYLDHGMARSVCKNEII